MIAHTLRAEGFDASEDGTGRGTPLVPVAFTCKDYGADAGDLAPTMRAMNHDGSHANGGGQVAVAFQERGRAEGRSLEIGGDVATPQMAVRRITPREAERLQGFPDDWTLIPRQARKKIEADYYDYIRRTYPSMPREDAERLARDGNRYKALGNSMAVPCMAWIGRRIAAVDALASAKELAT